MHVLVFGNGGGLLFTSLYAIMYMSACVTYKTRITQVTLKTINNTLLISKFSIPGTESENKHFLSANELLIFAMNMQNAYQKTVMFSICLLYRLRGQ